MLEKMSDQIVTPNEDIDSVCKSFEVKLLNFKNEVDSLTRFVYTEQTIKELAASNKKVLNALNKNVGFWNTTLNSLQHSIFITLGRILDVDPEDDSLASFFRFMENNKQIFSKSYFSHRWMNKNHDKHMREYLNTYIQDVYEPTTLEFRKIKKYISGLRKEFQADYVDARHYFAHKKIRSIGETLMIFEKVKTKKLEIFTVKLSSLHVMFWQMYHNGRKMAAPSARIRSSTKGFLSKNRQASYPPMITEQVVKETESVILKLI